MKDFNTTYSGYTTLPGAAMKMGELRFGEHRSLETGEMLRAAGVKKALILYDKGIYNAGIVEPVIEKIRAEKIEIVTFDEIPPEPPYTTVDSIAKLANENHIDGIVGIGGGSAIDTAKIVAIYHRHTEYGSIDRFLRPKDDPDRLIFDKPVTAYMILIPTTAGTGAEISNGSIIVNSVGAKDAIECPRPDAIILDPCMTATMPPYITATTGLDALAHCIEMYTSAVRNAYSKMYLGQAIEYIWDSLPKVIQNGSDMEARARMQLGAFLPLQDVCGHCHYGHAIGKTIGPACHKSHGHLVALALPHLVRLLDRSGPVEPELKEIARRMNLPVTDHSGEIIAAAIEELMEACGVKHLEKLGIQYQQIANGGRRTIETKRNSLLNCAAGMPEEEELNEIIKGMYYKDI